MNHGGSERVPSEPFSLEQLRQVAALFGAFASKPRLESNIASTLATLLLETGGDRAVLAIWEEQTRICRLYALTFGQDPAHMSRSEREAAFFLSSREPLILDALEPERQRKYMEVFSDPPVKSLLRAPVFFQGRSLGALELHSSQEGAFTASQLEMLSLVASSWGLILEKERLVLESQRRLERQRAFINMSRQINASLVLEDSLHSLSQASKQLLGLDKSVVMVLEDQFRLVFKSGISTRTAEVLIETMNGSLERFLHERKPLVLPHPGFLPAIEEHEVSQLVLLPMLYQEKLKGCFALFLASFQRILPEELLYIQTLANQAALAVENAILYEEGQQRAQEFSALFETAQAITSSLGTQAIVDRILSSAQRLIGADQGIIYQKVEDSDEMSCIAATGSYIEEVKSSRLRIGEGISGHVAQSGVGEHIADTTKDPRAKQISGTPEEPESMIAIPLKRKDIVFGVMILSRVGIRPFSEDDFRLISIFSTFAAASLENARLYAESAQMAITDYLTGLYNYRYFFKRLSEDLSHAKRYGQQLSVIILDLDRFKQYNDTYGHQEGDRLLTIVGNSMRSSMRLSDVAFRYGGDEFAVILPHTDAEEAAVVIHRLTKRLEEFLKPIELVKVGVSFGVSTFPSDSSDGEELFRLADQRMYGMKALHHG
jgi:diguanylate cyclase (GGDEF)-like protein